jgi:2-octaprenyl-6-methoxyphenol hydroxylase
MKPTTFDVAVVGMGAAGLAAAMALAREGFRTVLIGTPVVQRDGRTVALLDGSMQFFAHLGCAQDVATKASPLKVMRLIDDTGRIFRGPTLSFEAHELGLEAFGYNIENTDLVTALLAHARMFSYLTIIEKQVVDFSANLEFGELKLADGEEIAASCIIAADGRESLIRSKAGFEVKRSSYTQDVVTAILSHTRSHENISTEFHTPDGPFTLVPMHGTSSQGARSSLVWMTTSDKAKRLNAMNDADFASAVFKQSKGILGSVTVDGARGLTPLIGLSVSSYARGSVALIGEAAHVFPPIGAQGLNLGLRDGAALRDALVEARAAGEPLSEGLVRYHRGRQLDVPLRKWAVDTLNQNLIADFLPLDAARMAGMTLLKYIKPLRNFVMKEGLRPSLNVPSLMQKNDMGNRYIS